MTGFTSINKHLGQFFSYSGFYGQTASLTIARRGYTDFCGLSVARRAAPERGYKEDRPVQTSAGRPALNPRGLRRRRSGVRLFAVFTNVRVTFPPTFMAPAGLGEKSVHAPLGAAYTSAVIPPWRLLSPH